MKRLLILRHAKSDWGNSSLDDWERPLSARGVRDAPRVGDLLRAHGLVPDVIITSDAVRARSTARAVATAAGYRSDIVLEPSLYLATPEQILLVLNGQPDSAGSVMIVAHNPGLEDLVERLTGDPRAMPTAALAVVALPIDRWTDLDWSISGTVDEYWSPKD